jgi:hypothetical protein
MIANLGQIVGQLDKCATDMDNDPMSEHYGCYPPPWGQPFQDILDLHGVTVAEVRAEMKNRVSPKWMHFNTMADHALDIIEGEGEF